ncbi:STAS domain-containing protein [Umezawaea sp. NPDC059074]|uniref:STAS domain-containing protein n=1 Tax=Umezawaea sp. NPDC059074 TaxID=3346716 RepID=UPI0036BA25F5
MNELSWSVTREPERAVVAVTGVLTVGNAPRLEEALVSLASEADLVIDLEGLEFLDSSGLSVFIAAYKASTRNDTTVILDRVPAFLTRVLRVTGLHQLLLAPNQTS